MKPSDINLDVKQCRVLLGKTLRSGKCKGAEYAIVDILAFCKDLNNDKFNLIPIRPLVNYFHATSRLDGITSNTKVSGLSFLLEKGLMEKSLIYVKVNEDFCRTLVDASVSPTNQSGDQTMTATSSG